jgi:hypothetical protein
MATTWRLSQHICTSYGQFATFFFRRKLNWQPEENPGQHYAEEMTEFLVTGKRMFSDSPFVLNGLSQYELAIADLLRAE